MGTGRCWKGGENGYFLVAAGAATDEVPLDAIGIVADTVVDGTTDKELDVVVDVAGGEEAAVELPVADPDDPVAEELGVKLSIMCEPWMIYQRAGYAYP